MKRTGFKKPPYEEVIRKKREAQKRAVARQKARPNKVPTKRKKTSQKAKNKPIKTISTPVPAWIKAIPESKAHGAGTYQKRLWKLTSDYVRIRDFHKYGYCAATGKHFDTWKGPACQAGHLKPYSTCNGLYKFDVRNIHAQHGNSNKFGNYDDFRNFEKEVKRRGYDWDLFEQESNANNGARLYDSEVIEAIKQLLNQMAKLPEQPDYYERVVHLMTC